MPRRLVLLGAIFAAGITLAASWSWVATAADIPWKQEIFERTSVDEDIKDVLRGVLQQNGVRAVFRPGVAGKVTFRFSAMPLQAAFNKLVAEYGLEYEYDTQTRQVTFHSAKDRVLVRDFVRISHVSAAEVQDAPRRLGLPGKVSVDEATRLVLVEGTQDQVRSIKELIERMDGAARSRREAAEKARAAGDRTQDTEARARESERKARQADFERQRAEVERKLLEQCLNRDIRVIPLRFATVGQTTRTFAGRSLSVPGIDDSLRKLLGVAEGGRTEQGLSKEQRELIGQIAAGGLAAPGDLGSVAVGFAPGAGPQSGAAESSAMASALLCGVTVSVDPRTNAVIARGTLEELDRVEQLVKSLDKPVPMIEIEVMIVKASLDFTRSLGVRLSGEQNSSAVAGGQRFLGGVGGSSSTAATDTGATVPSGITTGLGATALTAAAPAFSATHGFVFGHVVQATRFALQAQIQAAEQDNNAQTIGAPTIVTLNNVAAKIDRKATRYFETITSSGNSVAATTALTALTPIDVGMRLDILPNVIPKEKETDEELVRLVVTTRNTSLGTANTTGVVSTSGQEVQTDVVIPNGRTFIMGGLLDDTRNDNVNGIPLLKDIPILGQLFRLNSKTDKLDQTLFFITPKIIYPEQIVPRDIAERRYLESRKLGLTDMRKDIQSKSTLTLAPVMPRRFKEEE